MAGASLPPETACHKHNRFHYSRRGHNSPNGDLRPGIYLSWYEAVAEISWVPTPTNASLPGVLARLGVGSLSPIASIIVLAVTAVFARRIRPGRGTAEVAMLAGLLASPLAWPGYFLLLVPSMLSERWGATRLLAACLLCIPNWFLFDSNVLWSLTYPLALLALFALRLSTARRPAAPSKI